jgi:hypothetical protein
MMTKFFVAVALIAGVIGFVAGFAACVWVQVNHPEDCPADHKLSGLSRKGCAATGRGGGDKERLWAMQNPVQESADKFTFDWKYWK